MKFKSAFKYYASNILSVLVLIAMSCVMLIENRIVGLVMLCVSAVFAIVLCLLRINEFRHLKNSVILINESLSEINKDRICTVPLPFAELYGITIRLLPALSDMTISARICFRV